MLHRLRLLVLGCLPLLSAALLANPAEEINATEKVLKAAGLETADAALLGFFRLRTPGAEDAATLARLFRALGDDNFDLREKASSELSKLGRKALPALRQARDSRDPEVARRAEECLRAIEREQNPPLVQAAARLLALRRPAGSASALLKFAPYADDPGTLEAVRDALVAVAVREGKPDPALVAALTASEALPRGLAGEALVRAGSGEVGAVKRLLEDADPLVRLRVGLAFVSRNDRTAVLRLIDLLAELPREQALPVEELLRQIALEKSPEVPAGDTPASRKQTRDAWSAWWTKHGDGVDLATINRKLVVAVDTSLGSFRIELFRDKAPVTVQNFLKYAEDQHYNGLVFHRVVSSFMIQGGGMEPGLKERKGRDPIQYEGANGLSNKRGTLAMARTIDPNSGTSQFFINVKDNEFLDHGRVAGRAGYCVFGKVVAGMDVVDKIKDVPTRAFGGHNDVPVDDVVIRSVRIVR